MALPTQQLVTWSLATQIKGTQPCQGAGDLRSPGCLNLHGAPHSFSSCLKHAPGLKARPGLALWHSPRWVPSRGREPTSHPQEAQQCMDHIPKLDPCRSFPYVAPSPTPAILSLARLVALPPKEPQCLCSSLPRLLPSPSRPALVPSPHSSLTATVKRAIRLCPSRLQPSVAPHCLQGQSRPASLGNEDSLRSLLPVFWPHHSATLHIAMALVTLTYLGFPERARLAQGSDHASDSQAWPPHPPYPSHLFCLLDILPLTCPLVW